MKLKLNDLNAHCQRPLKPLYLISGDEPLLAQEAIETLIRTAKQQGFDSIERFTIGPQFDVSQLQDATQSLSLFANKQVFVLQSEQKLPANVIDFLKQIAAQPNADTLILIRCPKLTPSEAKSKWLQTLEQAGIFLAIWPIERQQLPGWCQQRAGQLGFQLAPEAAQQIAAHTEGNLLAAKQLLEKLGLRYPKQTVSSEQLENSLSDDSRYSIFDLSSALLQGNAQRCWHMLQRLQQEGAEPVLLLWTLTKELRTLAQLQQQQQHTPLPTLFKQHRIWPKRQGEVQAALRRLSRAKCLNLLQQAAVIDRTIKGLNPGNPWQQLEQLCLQACGSAMPMVQSAAN